MKRTKDTSSIKKAAFGASLVLLVVACIEILTFVTYGLVTRHMFSWTEFQREREAIATTTTDRPKPHRWELKEILHPYLGYLMADPDESCPIYGFCDERSRGHRTAPLTEKRSDNFVVVILGGSFAHQTYVRSTKGLWEEELSKIPELQGKQIVVHTVAIGGYKQPQQLLALSYFLALGAHFDLVINIDGFNEVALPLSENVEKGVNPFFPRIWDKRVTAAQDEETLALIGEATYVKRQRRLWAMGFGTSVFRYSVIGNVLWRYKDRRYSLQETDTGYGFLYHKRSREDLPYVAAGPVYDLRGEEMYKDLAQMWARSSTQLAHISSGSGARYYHFLQPNQYVSDSKPMTAEERRIAIAESHPYRTGAESGYPYLIAEGARLRQLGVPFHDLTRLFSNNSEILYADSCCHLNEAGYNLVVRKVVQVVAGGFEGDSELP